MTGHSVFSCLSVRLSLSRALALFDPASDVSFEFHDAALACAS
jgi:hypothetical protein